MFAGVLGDFVGLTAWFSTPPASTIKPLFLQGFFAVKNRLPQILVAIEG
jgi:hypothetical protein